MATAGRLVAAAAALFALGATEAPAAPVAVPVDLELVLAIDTSPSISLAEFFLQRRGYVAAFRSPQLFDAVRTGLYGRIAVTYVEWSGTDHQQVVVPWTLIDSAASAAGFATFLESARTMSYRGTSISAALAFANALFDRNAYGGERLAIDVSGDGPNSVGPPVELARDAVIAAGVTINGLPVMTSPAVDDLDDYYYRCVIGGPGAFMVTIERSEDFATAIREKLVREIAARSTDLPMPVVKASTAPAGCDD